MAASGSIHFEISERKILLRLFDVGFVLALLHFVGSTFDFDYFTIVDRELDRSTRYYNQGFVNDFGFRRFRGRRNNRRFFGPRFVSSSSYPVDEYSSTADIVMGKGEKPVADSQAYDALDVLQQLQSSIRLPGENEE